MMLLAFIVGCVAWFPQCQAATKALAREKLLLRRARLQRASEEGGTEPFIVSFRVTIDAQEGTVGADNEELAKNLSASINTPGSEMAGTMRYSVARTFNGTFPPVQWPPSTTWAAMQPFSAPQAVQQAMYAPTVTTTAPQTAMSMALKAYRIAQENKIEYDKLTSKMTRATRAHADGLVFGNPMGTVPPLSGMEQDSSGIDERDRMKQTAAVPHTLGRLIYDAFVNTPKPIEMTTAGPTPGFPVFPGNPGSVLARVTPVPNSQLGVR